MMLFNVVITFASVDKLLQETIQIIASNIFLCCCLV